MELEVIEKATVICASIERCRDFTIDACCVNGKENPLGKMSSSKGLFKPWKKLVKGLLRMRSG